jgi:hypothetical protein
MAGTPCVTPNGVATDEPDDTVPNTLLKGAVAVALRNILLHKK